MDTRLIEAVKTLFFQWVGGSQDPLRWGLAVGIGLLAGACVMTWMFSRLSDSGVLFRSVLPLVAAGAAVVLVAAALAREFLCPHVRFASPLWVMTVVAFLAFLLIVLPGAARILSVSAPVTLAALLGAGLAVVLFAYLMLLGYDTLTHGQKDIRARRSMRRAQERALTY